MKKFLVFLWAMLLLFGIGVRANATLWDRGGGLIYDDYLDITWLQDANYGIGSGYDDSSGRMTWYNAVAWADSLSYYDSVRGVTYDDWRLPTTVDGPHEGGYDGTTTAGYNITTSEMGYMFYVNLGNLGYRATDGTYPQLGWGLNNSSPFTNLQSTFYWSGTESAFSVGSWGFFFSTGEQRLVYQGAGRYAWAVRDGDVSSLPNQPPIADAGPDQTVECTGLEGTLITLDGSGSSDPDSTPGTNDDIVSFKWYEAEILIGDSEVLDYLFEVDTHPITLEVTDSYGETDSDPTNIIIQDTTPPSISVSVSPDILWPPNHKMVHVTATVTATDNCDTEPAIELVSIVMSESDEISTFDPNYDLSVNDGHTLVDIQIVDDYNFDLRCERSGKSDGRTYTITYKAIDDSGNESTASTEVLVPHSM